MRMRLVVSLLVLCLSAQAVIIDRIAIIVNNRIIKDSDIDLEVRVIDFLNGRPLAMTAAARKDAANRLIDQAVIRREIRIGQYPTATLEEADAQLAALNKGRFHGEAATEKALAHYGLTKEDLRLQFQWQLTVLHFIDARFRPGVAATDEKETAEKVNQQFFAWLDEQRKDAPIQYREEELQ